MILYIRLILVFLTIQSFMPTSSIYKPYTQINLNLQMQQEDKGQKLQQFKHNFLEKETLKISNVQELNNNLRNKVQNRDQIDERIVKKMLSPANPILDKNISPDEQISFKLVNSIMQTSQKRKQKSDFYYQRRTKRLNENQQDCIPEILTLHNGYDQCNMLYRKFNNTELNQLNRKKYFASVFFPIFLRQNNKFQMPINIPSYEGMRKPCLNNKQSLIQNIDQELDFSSNFQSGNLFAVFKTGPYTYDLVLQNDFNTIGCTQWFYFSVNNKQNKNILAKFNIVNLVNYKGSSLYNNGMKPMVYSLKSSKGWKRKGQNISYEKNYLQREGSKKFYNSLSFSYYFTKQNDTVQFAHAIPYTYSRLLEVLKLFQSSKKCIVKSLGNTPMKKMIPIIKFESENNKIPKKAIVIMARQHPGQVQGSFAIEGILMNLLKISSTEIQFLLWRFNIYVIPMINVDGVVLGNYRSNAFGYDLNRNWEGQQKSKHPQIVYIKKEIKKIMAKFPIQLIIDLHGHSRKMNSFFYGNNFGPNPIMLPLIASKINPFISFQDCTFSIQRNQKSKTARNILGNMIKDNGNVYTYQMSFYGGIKNGKTINFYEQNFKQLGKDLLISMYKVYVQTYKEQKTLKQSLYLKDIRKQIQVIQHDVAEKENSMSDSQADSQRQVLQQQKKEQLQKNIRQNQQSPQNKYLLQSNNMENSNLTQQLSTIMSQSISKHLSTKFNRKSQNQINMNELLKMVPRMKRGVSLEINNSEKTLLNSDQSIQQKTKKQKVYAQKLKIYGETYLIRPSQQLTRSQDYNTLDDHKKCVRVFSLFSPQKRNQYNNNNLNSFSFVEKISRNRSKNFSTLIPSRREWKQQQALINDIVKVNRLEYKKIQRNQGKLKSSISKSPSKKQGIFKLPSIVNQHKR